MTSRQLDPELERRIAALEAEQREGAGFGGADWFWLAVLGVAGPAALLAWGWSS
jgi:hypothetical protein